MASGHTAIDMLSDPVGAVERLETEWAGADVLISARRVGPTGKAYGLDMTDEMLELARAKKRSNPLGIAATLNTKLAAVAKVRR